MILTKIVALKTISKRVTKYGYGALPRPVLLTSAEVQRVAGGLVQPPKDPHPIPPTTGPMLPTKDPFNPPPPA